MKCIKSAINILSQFGKNDSTRITILLVLSQNFKYLGENEEKLANDDFSV